MEVSKPSDPLLAQTPNEPPRLSDPLLPQTPNEPPRLSDPLLPQTPQGDNEAPKKKQRKRYKAE